MLRLVLPLLLSFAPPVRAEGEAERLFNDAQKRWEDAQRRRESGERTLGERLGEAAGRAVELREGYRDMKDAAAKRELDAALESKGARSYFRETFDLGSEPADRQIDLPGRLVGKIVVLGYSDSRRRLTLQLSAEPIHNPQDLPAGVRACSAGYPVELSPQDLCSFNMGDGHVLTLDWRRDLDGVQLNVRLWRFSPS